jgi:general secretion pathway protein E
MANMDITEKRHPQDGRIKSSFAKRRMDLRISVIPALYGEKVVLRLLDVDATSIPLESMGCNHDIYEELLSLIEKPQGVIFITGPTGSGKTSTLYACLNHIKSENINITTLEDPVEYEMPGVTQIAINEKIGLTFTETLRSVLRQDPDVIMVGEMRDSETARIAMQASLTGHLVFSTLHTNDSVSAVTRLVDMGIPSYLISSSLSGVLAQRLVRTICPRCKETYQPSVEELIQLGIDPQDNFGPFYQGKGCSYCDFTGFYGRTGIFELLMLDDNIRTLITSGAPDSLIRDKAQAKGMQPLRKVGLIKVKEGKTTTKEILRVTIK